METTHSDVRKHQRFNHDIGTIAELDLELTDSNFTSSVWGLVINDSFSGCAMVIATNEILTPNQNCSVKFPTLHPFPARIIWVTSLDTNVLKIGIEYID